jgi:hypothetical protein
MLTISDQSQQRWYLSIKLNMQLRWLELILIKIQEINTIESFYKEIFRTQLQTKPLIKVNKMV